jgi:hypothetical protein
MIAKVLPLLNRLIPSSLARKGLAKNIPQLDGFFESAVAAGYGIDTALDFLRDQHNDNQEGLRADEQAAQARVNQQGAVGKGIDQLTSMAGLGLGAAAIPSVIGNLFQGKGEREQPPPIPPPELPPEIQKDRQRIMAMNEFNKRKKKNPSELSREELLTQFDEGQQTMQGKENLAQTMREITEALKRMRGNG